FGRWLGVFGPRSSQEHAAAGSTERIASHLWKEKDVPMRAFRSAHRPRASIRARKTHLGFETLEDRTLLSGLGLAKPHYVIEHAAGKVGPFGTSGPTGLMLSQVRHAYG